MPSKDPVNEWWRRLAKEREAADAAAEGAAYGPEAWTDPALLDKRIATLEAQLAAAQERHIGPGTPSARLEYLLSELARLFPDVRNQLQSAPPELNYIAAIATALASSRSACAVAVALRAYADSCAEEYPLLAADLRAKLATPNAEFTGGPPGPSGGIDGSAPTKGK